MGGVVVQSLGEFFTLLRDLKGGVSVVSGGLMRVV